MNDEITPEVGSDVVESEDNSEVQNTPETATITCRIESLTDNAFIGLTVQDVRDQFADILNIPAEATPFINSERVDEDYTVQAGDKVTFSLALGEKGA